MDIGESARGNQVREAHDHGADWEGEYALSIDAGSAGSCGAVVVGGPVDLSNFNVTAQARVTGSRQRIAVTPTLTVAGSDSVRAQIRLKVPNDDIALTFDEDAGAKRQFEVQVFVSQAGVRKSEMKIKVKVNDAASRATV